MGERLYPAVVAALLGALVALALLVPYVAAQYRRRGTVGLGRSVLALSALVYSLALVSYVLLPLPEVTSGLCRGGGAGVQLHPGRFVSDILRHGVSGPAVLVRNPALQQAVFNVALFVPLGMFVRYLGSRAVAVTTVIGLGVSLLIELTQLTGDWFAFPCAYRLFDVDDLIMNTVGALLGALVAPVLRLVPGQRLQNPPGAPRPVTAVRRLLGMLCDVLAGLGVGLVLSFAYTATLLVTHTHVPPALDSTVHIVLVGVLPALLALVVLLRTHRTPGEAVVRLRPVGPVGGIRLGVRWLVGIGGYLLLTVGQGGSTLAQLLGLASVVAVFLTRGHRGLAHRIVGWDVEDDRCTTGHGAGAGDEAGGRTVTAPGSVEA